jgi:hypothetical protein
MILNFGKYTVRAKIRNVNPDYIEEDIFDSELEADKDEEEEYLE